MVVIEAIVASMVVMVAKGVDREELTCSARY
jgi:hypothetical protein